MKHLFIIVGIVAVLIGLGFVFPAVAEWRDLGSLPLVGTFLMSLGGILTLGGIGAVAHGVRMRRVSV